MLAAACRGGGGEDTHSVMMIQISMDAGQNTEAGRYRSIYYFYYNVYSYISYIMIDS